MTVSMISLFRLARDEVRATLRRPSRLLELKSWPKVRRVALRWWRGFRLARAGSGWKYPAGSGLHIRQYPSYEDYMRHQQAKLETLGLEGYERRLRTRLVERLEEDGFAESGGNALCLGARLGAEVRAFRDLGFFAVGVDLNPGSENRYVLYGDFHDLSFPASSADVVFTNALDHALDIERLLAEVGRVLRPRGRFVVEAGRGLADEAGYGDYETLHWDHFDDLAALVAKAGFRELHRRAIDYPWPGWHSVFAHRDDEP